MHRIIRQPHNGSDPGRAAALLAAFLFFFILPVLWLFHVNALIVTGVAPLLSGARVVWPGPAGYRDYGHSEPAVTERQAEMFAARVVIPLPG